MIRNARAEDAAEIRAIYNHYIKNTVVTFEEEEISVEEMAVRMGEVQAKYPWLVCETEDGLVGYAYASPWKSRCAYRYSVEVSVYLREGSSGRGLGTALYRDLLDKLRGMQLHGVIGGIALPNEACVALHEKFGFEKVAHFREVGHKFGKWVDVVYYELLL